MLKSFNKGFTWSEALIGGSISGRGLGFAVVQVLFILVVSLSDYNTVSSFVFHFNRTSTIWPGKKTMYCDRSAYYQKAIKATARQLLIYSNLLWLFLLFGWLVRFSFIFIFSKQFSALLMVDYSSFWLLVSDIIFRNELPPIRQNVSCFIFNLTVEELKFTSYQQIYLWRFRVIIFFFKYIKVIINFEFAILVP